MDNQHHYGWMAVVLIIVCVCVYIWASNRPNIDNYGKDSTHNEQHRQDWPLSVHIGEGGCANLAAQRELVHNAKAVAVTTSVKH